MLNAELARRYAKALLGSVAKGEAVEQTAVELKMILQVSADNPALNNFLKSPILPASDKQAVVREVFKGKAEQLTVDFLCLLIEKQRFKLLPAISIALDDLIEEMRGVARVKVISALPVQENEKNYIHQRLEKWLRQSVKLAVEVNPALLCGIQICIGDRLFDGSGLGRLTHLRATLSAF
jgi:F-type H+-transporting ATPase subunit delta